MASGHRIELVNQAQQRLMMIGIDSTTKETLLNVDEIVEAYPGGMNALLGEGLRQRDPGLPAQVRTH